MNKFGKWVLAFSLAFGAVIPVAHVQVANASAPKNDYANHEFKADIEWALKNKVMFAFPDGSFHPDETVTQAHFLAGFVNYYKLKEVAPVEELSGNHWAKGVYERAKKAGWLEGIPIEPEKQMTRDDGALILLNILKPYYKVAKGKYPLTPAQKANGLSFMRLKDNIARGHLPLTRAYTANTINSVAIFVGVVNEAEKVAMNFHKSLKVVNGRITGKFPYYNQNVMRAQLGVLFIGEEGGAVVSKAGQTFSYPLNKIENFEFRADTYFSALLSGYRYTDLKTLKKEKIWMNVYEQ